MTEKLNCKVLPCSTPAPYPTRVASDLTLFGQTAQTAGPGWVTFVMLPGFGRVLPAALGRASAPELLGKGGQGTLLNCM